VESASSGADLKAAAELDLARLGEGDARIEIVDYDASWPDRFRAEAERLAAVVPVLRLHHIGSTAVTGLAAKPVIDMTRAPRPVGRCQGDRSRQYG
jgi:GrpB-like predicted nucleotidyltransferase (UPF0157 family)